MIYLFDENEKLFKVLKKESLKSADQTYSLTTENYVSDRLTIETKGMNANEVEQAHFMAIQSLEDRHKFHYFFIARKETDKTTILEGVQSGIEELRKTPVYDKRPRGLSARNVIEDLLRDTNWIPRFIADTGLKNTNLYYTSVFEALKKVCKVWGLEMQFFVEMNGNQIGARYIDFKKKIGEATGKRVVYGHNALKILNESESTNLFTALIGRGKGEQVSSAEETGNQVDGYGRKINFEEIVWSKSKGNPVDKPAGQKYVEIPEMTQKYGILNADGTRRAKIGFIDFGDEEDKEALLQQTYEALKDASRPKLTLKTSSVYLKNVGIGDTIRVVRHDRKLDYETRVFEITINRLNNKSSDIKLGDRTSQSNEAKIQSAADRAVEEFVEGNFNDFIQNLPDFLPTADGFNNNWYSDEDPTVTYPKKVMIGDIWYKPDPEHEGHKIMLRWTGEMWEEILRTYNAERLKEQIEAEMAEVDGKMKSLDAEMRSRVADLLNKAGLAQSTGEEAKRLAEKANADLVKERERSNSAIQGALSEARRLDQEERKATERAILAAKTGAVVEATNLLNVAKRALENDLSNANRLILESKRILESQVSGVSTELTKTNDTIKTLAKKTDVDRVNQRLSSAETSITQQAGQISLKANQQTVDGLTNRVRSAESSITQQANQIALKANTSDVNTLKNRVLTAESSLTVQSGQIAAKANKTDVDTLSSKVSRAESSLQVQAGQIAAKASKTDVDNMGQRIATAEASLTAQAGEIAQRVRKSDFDRETGRLSTVEASVRNLGDRVTTEISRTEAKIPSSVGLRNLILKSADFGNPYKQNGSRTTVTAPGDFFEIYSQGYTSNAWGGTGFNLSADTLRADEDYSFYTQVYFDSTAPLDGAFVIQFKDHSLNKNYFSYAVDTSVKDRWIDVAFTFKPRETHSVKNYELFIYFVKNGRARLKPPIMVEGRLIPTSHVPAPEDTIQEIQSVKTIITQTAEGVTQLSTKVNQNKDKLTQQETRVNQLIGEVSSKVSKTEYDNLKRTVDNQTTQLRQTTESINLKADRTLVTTVQTAATEAKNLANSATAKANQADSKATDATTKANQASSKADSAVNTAGQASEKATSADSKATSAITKADNASTKADSAVNTANQASQKATSAENKANGATAKAEDATRKAAEAMGKSVDALAKAGLVDTKAAEALAKAIQNSQSISRAQAELQVTNDAIKTKVSKVDFDLANRKLATAETTINTLAGQISTKLSRTEVVQTIESKGYQTAAQVDSKITSKGYQTANQVDSLVQAKGYQTAGQVEAAITSKGYVTTSTFSNTIQQTERGMTARIAQVETRIPSSFSHRNLMRGTSDIWGPFRDITLKENWLFDLGQVSFGDQTGIYPDTKVNLFVYVSADNIVLDESVANRRMYVQGRIRDSGGNWTWTNWTRYHPFAGKWSRNLNVGNNYALIKVSGVVTREMYQNSKGFELQMRIDGVKSGKFHIRALMLTTGDVAPDYWSPAPEDFATTIALHEVRDTVDSHTRTLTAQGRTISQFTQTAEGIVSRVASTESGVARLDGRANFVESALNATKTEVSQLAGSWAVRNLRSTGEIVNQINLNNDGLVRIQGKKIRLTGDTMIDRAVIQAAHIASVNASTITTGTLNAGDVNIINMNASNIVTGQMSANRIRGGTISALNDRSQINLQNGRFYVSDNEAGFFRIDSNASTMGLKFINTPITIAGTARKVSRVILGGDRRNESSDSNFGWDKGGFTGIVISTIQGTRANENWQSDDLQIVSDRVVFSHSYYRDDQTNIPQQGWEMHTFIGNSPRQGHVVLRPYNIDKNLGIIDTGNVYLWPRKDKGVSLIQVLRELKIAFVHIKNAGWSEDARRAIISSIDKLSSMGI